MHARLGTIGHIVRSESVRSQRNDWLFRTLALHIEVSVSVGKQAFCIESPLCKADICRKDAADASCVSMLRICLGRVAVFNVYTTPPEL